MDKAYRTAGDLRRDFDRIAGFEADGWGHNRHYHGFLLRSLPAHVEQSLDVGCGTGEFARLLAARSSHVLAIDLSPEMIRVARERSHPLENIEYEVADVSGMPLPPSKFDVIASIATLHHLPLESTLVRLAECLKPGGTLVVLDLYERAGAIDRWLDVCAVVGNLAHRLLPGDGVVPSKEAQAAWREHGETDRYLDFNEVARIAADVLPGAVLRRHLYWRYSLVWTKADRKGIAFSSANMG